jgi:hypothetical protein
MWYIKNRSMVFYYKVPTIILTSQNYVQEWKLFCPDLPSLGNPKSHHHNSKSIRIQNSNLQCSMSGPYLKCFVHQNHVIILPFNSLISCWIYLIIPLLLVIIIQFFIWALHYLWGWNSHDVQILIYFFIHSLIPRISKQNSMIINIVHKIIFIFHSFYNMKFDPFLSKTSQKINCVTDSTK